MLGEMGALSRIIHERWKAINKNKKPPRDAFKMGLRKLGKLVDGNLTEEERIVLNIDRLKNGCSDERFLEWTAKEYITAFDHNVKKGKNEPPNPNLMNSIINDKYGTDRQYVVATEKKFEHLPVVHIPFFADEAWKPDTTYYPAIEEFGPMEDIIPLMTHEEFESNIRLSSEIKRQYAESVVSFDVRQFAQDTESLPEPKPIDPEEIVLMADLFSRPLTPLPF